MNAIILTIGDEILIGQVTDTNSAFISSLLTANGISVVRKIALADTETAIEKELSSAMQEADLVISTGGLGPTSDDRTRQVLCRYFNCLSVENPDVMADVMRFVEQRGSVMNNLNRRQAEVPQCAEILRNPVGTAPGLWFSAGPKVFVALPGVPFEMEHLMVNEVIPRLRQRYELPSISMLTIHTTGLPESRMAELLSEFEKQLPASVSLAYLPSPGFVRLRLMCKAERTYASQTIQALATQIKQLIPDAVYGYNDDTLQQVVGQLLAERGHSLSVAESCTGGTIAAMITSVPGCSVYFKGGLVAYSNEVKIHQLNVPAEIIAIHGAVSQPVAEAMAVGCCKKFETHWAVAVSGIAGPGGGTPDKPVGSVCIAVAYKQTLVASEKFRFGDHRDRNIRRASVAALNMLRLALLNKRES